MTDCGEVSFHGATFSGDLVSFMTAQFSASAIDFRQAKITGPRLSSPVPTSPVARSILATVAIAAFRPASPLADRHTAVRKSATDTKSATGLLRPPLRFSRPAKTPQHDPCALPGVLCRRELVSTQFIRAGEMSELHPSRPISLQCSGCVRPSSR